MKESLHLGRVSLITCAGLGRARVPLSRQSGTWYVSPVPGTWYPVPRKRYPALVPGTQYLVLGTRYPVRSPWYLVPGMRYPVYWYPVPDSSYQGNNPRPPLIYLFINYYLLIHYLLIHWARAQPRVPGSRARARAPLPQVDGGTLTL